MPPSLDKFMKEVNLTLEARMPTKTTSEGTEFTIDEELQNHLILSCINWIRSIADTHPDVTPFDVLSALNHLLVQGILDLFDDPFDLPHAVQLRNEMTKQADALFWIHANDKFGDSTEIIE
jgi:hypothetical protein